MPPDDPAKSHPSGRSTPSGVPQRLEAAPTGEGPDPSDPLASRPLTIDDVPRLGSGTGIAIGCTVVVAGAIALFWLVRGLFLHAP
jgi:hypothetical protein